MFSHVSWISSFENLLNYHEMILGIGKSGAKVFNNFLKKHFPIKSDFYKEFVCLDYACEP
jgi:hypothetical protein